MNHNKGLLYSGDESITIAGLKNLEKVSSDIFPEIQARTEKESIKRTIEGEDDFHYKLLLIKSKPHIIYYMGNIDILNYSILGIVGPRMHSSYATEILTKLFALAPSYHFATISGLAPGVDQLCHRLSLQKGIPTIAVLGGGFRHFLSGRDRELIQEIVTNGGLVISEFRLFQEPQTYTFPQRNRIIAGFISSRSWCQKWESHYRKFCHRYGKASIWSSK
ncbi:MAG: DNA-processing protein DprA [candidate division SR1 bacterium]|nr:DNA-processing protein DprA [candidate division SR1 bacterium]